MQIFTEVLLRQSTGGFLLLSQSIFREQSNSLARLQF